MMMYFGQKELCVALVKWGVGGLLRKLAKTIEEKKDMNIYSKEFISNLKKSEGFQAKVYKCPAGKLTVGYGRNLEDRGITQFEAEYLMMNDVEDTEKELSNRLSYWNRIDRVRQEVLIDMGFNMGVGGLLKFVKTLGFVEKGNYRQASEEMLRSRWAEQVGNRAIKLSQVMKSGKW